MRLVDQTVDEPLKFAPGTTNPLVVPSLLKTILLSFDLQQPIRYGADTVGHLVGMVLVTQLLVPPITFSGTIIQHSIMINILNMHGRMELQYRAGTLLRLQVG